MQLRGTRPPHPQHPPLPQSRLPAAPEARPVPFPAEAASEVGARLGRQDLDPGRVAGLAEDVPVQRVAALVVPLGEEPSTVLGRKRKIPKLPP